MTNQEIFEGLLASDTDTITYLYRKYTPILLGYVLKNSGSKADAYELVHDTIIVVWDKVREGKYQPTSSAFEAYFFTIANKLWLVELRKRKKKSSLDTVSDLENLTDDDDAILKHLERERLFETLDYLLQMMPENSCKYLLYSFYSEGKKLKDIAQELGKEYSNVRKQIHDCRLRLRGQAEIIIRQLGDDYAV